MALALLLSGAAIAASKLPVKPKKPALTAEQKTAQLILKSMSLRDRVAQLIVATCYGDAPATKSPEYQKYKHWVRDLRIGGFIVANRVDHGAVRNAEPHAMALFLNQMQKMSRTPLLVAADFERGASMRVTGGAQFPYNMAYGAGRDLDAVRYEGLATARQARAIGVQWIFAPVADVNNNPENPVINIAQLRRECRRRGAGRRRLYRRRALRSEESRAGHGETFSRPRRHRYRQPHGARPGDREYRSAWRRWSSSHSAPPSRTASTPS